MQLNSKLQRYNFELYKHRIFWLDSKFSLLYFVWTLIKLYIWIKRKFAFLFDVTRNFELLNFEFTDKFSIQKGTILNLNQQTKLLALIQNFEPVFEILFWTLISCLTATFSVKTSLNTFFLLIIFQFDSEFCVWVQNFVYNVKRFAFKFKNEIL